jgi:transglutaminase-like putative cysteine protease
VQVYLPQAGWLDFDPTNNLVGSRDLVRVAVAQRAYQVLPLSGTWFGNASDSLGMTVAVNVTSVERLPAGPSTSIIHPEAADAAMERIVSKERG